MNDDGQTNAADVASLYASFGATSWQADLNVDGAVTIDDVDALVGQLVRTSRADFNLDRRVDGTDFLIWQRGLGGGTRFDEGDATLDGQVAAGDLATWQSQFGMIAPTSVAAASLVPEPAAGRLVLVALVAVLLQRSTPVAAAFRKRITVCNDQRQEI